MFSFIIRINILILILYGCKVNNTSVNDYSSDQQTVISEEIEQPVFQEEPKVYRPEQTKNHDLLHTKLEVSFNWEKQYLNGIATLELRPYFYPQKELELDAKNFDIHSVTLVKPDKEFPLTYDYDNWILTVQLDREYQRNEKYQVRIDYTAKPNEREAEGSAAITSDKGLYFINPLGTDPDKPQQIWTQGETESSSFWFPTIDAPNERTTQEMYITVEDRFKTLSNGVLVSSKKNTDGTRTDYWRMDLSHAPYLFMMAIGEYAIVEDEWNGIPLSYYVEPAYEPHAKDIFGRTPEMMTFFSDLLGYPYPWPKYAQVVVRDFVSGAMENTTASVYMEELQIDSRELIDYNWDGIIAHELFHHWMGDLLTCESWANLPLNEAFANYSEYLWFEYKEGVDEADYHGLQELNKYLNEAETKQEDLIRFYYDDREDMFDSHSYAKGGRILHMLREILGDEAFFASLKHYVKENAFEDVEVHDLRLSFEEVTGQDLNWFFNQWFLASGHPEIKVAHEYDSGNFKIEIWQLQDPDKTPIYRLPVNFKIWMGETQITYELQIEDGYQQFNFELPQKPDLFVFDSEQYLLAEIEHEKSKEELRFQYHHSNKFLARYRALEKLIEQPVENFETIFAALNDSSWPIRQLAVNSFENFTGEKLAQVKKKLEWISLNDKKSLVRADALNVLTSYNFNEHKDVFREALKDSSYSVLGIGLYAYAESDAPDKLKVLSQYEDYNNINIIFPIANYYSQNSAVHDKYAWFDSKINSMQGTDLWYMLQFFGEYLMNAPIDQQKEGARLLEDKARNSNSYYIRLAAYQALGLLEFENVEKIRQDIRNKETDSRLNQIYMNME